MYDTEIATHSFFPFSSRTPWRSSHFALFFPFHTYIFARFLLDMQCPWFGCASAKCMYLNPLKFGLLLFMWIFSPLPSCAVPHLSVHVPHLLFTTNPDRIVHYKYGTTTCHRIMKRDGEHSVFFMKIPINFTPFQFQWRTVLCICTWCLKLFKVFISM